jgi:hypothetical protein
MGGATDLQTLITALAFKYMAQGKLSHHHIPDNPYVESERRQIFFGAAIGIPTFYVHKDTGNQFLKRIVARTGQVRPSHRYPGYLRVHNLEYRKALVQVLLEDAADLIEALNLKGTLTDLMVRLDQPERHSTAGKLTRGILREMNVKSPMGVTAREFNIGAEKYYRGTLRRRHLDESLRFLEEDFLKIDLERGGADSSASATLRFLLQGKSASEYLRSVRREVLDERIQAQPLRKLINLLLHTIHLDTQQAEKLLENKTSHADNPAPVHRA